MKVGSHKLGWGEIPKSDKFILESALGAYTPLGGGEISLEINLSSIGKAIADSIKNYKTADDCFCSDGTPGTVTDAVFGQRRPVTLPDVIILE